MIRSDQTDLSISAPSQTARERCPKMAKGQNWQIWICYVTCPINLIIKHREIITLHGVSMCYSRTCLGSHIWWIWEIRHLDPKNAFKISTPASPFFFTINPKWVSRIKCLHVWSGLHLNAQEWYDGGWGGGGGGGRGGRGGVCRVRDIILTGALAQFPTTHVNCPQKKSVLAENTTGESDVKMNVIHHLSDTYMRKKRIVTLSQLQKHIVKTKNSTLPCLTSIICLDMSSWRGQLYASVGSHVCGP